MQQEERSKKSRTQVLEAALKLFSHQGYRGTSIRDIAVAASLSTGNVYHHFPDKESIFRALLDEYWHAIDQPDFPVNKALAEGAFPDDLEALGRAARESVELYRGHVSLIYVDVVEFEGEHIRRFYENMAQRFASFLERSEQGAELRRKLRPEVSPLSAVMLASRIFLNYFAVEVVFGVPNHFGKKSDEIVREIAEILRHGLLRPEAAAAPAPRRPAGRKPRATQAKGSVRRTRASRITRSS